MAARNRGAAEAIADGVEMLVFLDVDCIPDHELIAAYAAAAKATSSERPAVFCGPVGYLPPLTATSVSESTLAFLARDHPARQFGRSRRLPDPNLFWSLSFAMTAPSWLTIGGFCESYVGYGGEDTDFAQLVRASGGTLHWVAGARAYHQHHESHDPPIQHVASIVRNAEMFRRRWGWYPMLAWLEEFERRGLACYDEGTGTWRETSPQWPPSQVPSRGGDRG